MNPVLKCALLKSDVDADAAIVRFTVMPKAAPDPAGAVRLAKQFLQNVRTIEIIAAGKVTSTIRNCAGQWIVCTPIDSAI